MFKIYKLEMIPDQYGGFYRAHVNLAGTNSTMKVRGKPKLVYSAYFDVFFHRGKKEWRVRIPDVWRIVNENLGCVQAKLPARQKEIERLREAGEKVEADKLQYDWNPCSHCKHTDVCDEKYKVLNVYPKLNLFGSSNKNTWILAMNVGAAVVKKVAPNDKIGSDQPFQGCTKCVYGQYVVRGSDPDGIDPVTMSATADPAEYDKMERSLSTMDAREFRDTRAKLPSHRCLLSGDLVWDNDACYSYIWKKLVYRNVDWVPVVTFATIQDSIIVGGSGTLSVSLPVEYLEEVQ